MDREQAERLIAALESIARSLHGSGDVLLIAALLLGQMIMLGMCATR